MNQSSTEWWNSSETAKQEITKRRKKNKAMKMINSAKWLSACLIWQHWASFLNTDRSHHNKESAAEDTSWVLITLGTKVPYLTHLIIFLGLTGALLPHYDVKVSERTKSDWLLYFPPVIIFTFGDPKKGVLRTFKTNISWHVWLRGSSNKCQLTHVYTQTHRCRDW